MTSSSTEVKLHLKKPILNYDGVPLKDQDDFVQIKRKNPGMSREQALKKSKNILLGSYLPSILLSTPTKDPVERMKLFRWASKIHDKMLTTKGELALDSNQIIELKGYVEKTKMGNTSIIAPILIEFENLLSEINSKQS